MSRRSPKSDRSFGTRASGKSGRERVSRGQLIRDRYSTDRYPTAEEFIKAVERNPEHFDPSNENFFPFDYGQNSSNFKDPGLRGFGGSNLKTNRPTRSNWIADNPIELDAGSDPGSVSVSVEAWNNDQGDSVSVVAGVDLIPMGIDINVNGDVGTIAVDLGMPGDAIGVTVGASFDTETGEVIGGQVGLAGGGLSVNVSQIKKDGEICSTITVTYMGIGTAYQRCRKDDDNDEKDPQKEPPPNDEIPPAPPIELIPGNPNDTVFVIASANQYGRTEISTIYNDKTYTYSSFTQYSASSSVGSGYAIISENLTARSWNNEGFDQSIDEQALTYLPWRGQPYPELEVTPQYILDDPGFKQYGWYNVQGMYMGSGGIYLGAIAKVNAMLQDYYSNIIESAEGYKRTFWRVKKIDFYHIIETGKEGPEKPKEPDPPIPPSEEDMGCCDLEPVMSMLRKLNQALAVDEVIGPGLELPNEWILPTGKGRSKMKNYLEIAVFLAKMQDHLGVHPLTVQIADLNAGQEGNQEFKKYYPNGTKAIQEILTILHDENSDSADRLNLQMRLAVLNTRIFLTVASISRSLRGVFQFLGVPIREKREAVPLPFDFAFGLRKNKGFSNDAKKDGEELERNMKKLQEELNKNTENATEALLAKFLADSDQPIGYETFDPNLPDLLDRLKQLLDKK